MQIKRLKLSGFKSFVEPAELRVDPGLTGVVGPNGCGKSNLLEAIRWVMGENSPKSMRSGGMDDVIFAGTEARPPRDFAEVVLQGSDAAGEELEVVRRIERGAGSAYRVNGRDVRAKDVALTFADAATGAHSPALVSQGKIAQLIAAKPAERRAMLEEAAGIAGLHVRRKDAESKLRQTEANLARLEDLMAGLDAQMASLKRQARQAERYQKLSGQIKTAEARLLFARWRDAAAAAEEARAAAGEADTLVERAKAAAAAQQGLQREAAGKLASARDTLADRRDDASAHGHRMAALTSQLEAAENRLADLDRQRERLEQDRGDADRLTSDAAEALQRLEKNIAESAATLARDEEGRGALLAAHEKAESAARAAELALAKATADHAGVEAEWRVVEAEIEQAQTRLARLESDSARLEEALNGLDAAGDPAKKVKQAAREVEAASGAVAELRKVLQEEQARSSALAQSREEAATAQSAARAELAGIEREYQALTRDAEAREKQAQQSEALPLALDTLRAKPGYERAIAAVLGRDARSPLGAPKGADDGRFWTGREPMERVRGSILDHIAAFPCELEARLAKVHYCEEDDRRELAPGEWLVTREGHLRRWDGFVARGEGSAEAAQLEAANRLARCEKALPNLRETAEKASAKLENIEDERAALRKDLAARETAIGEAIEAERTALRALDLAEAEAERHERRSGEIAQDKEELAKQLAQAKAELASAEEKRAALPSPDAGRALLDSAQASHEATRAAIQSAAAELAAHDQALAVARERNAAQRSEKSNWEARSGEAARRMAEVASRLEEIASERAVTAAKPEGLIEEIEQGDAVRDRLAGELAEAEAALVEAQEEVDRADTSLANANEALSQARESRAALSAQAENQESRRGEMARIAGERFQCPPPMLGTNFEFDCEEVGDASSEAEEMDRLTASRERIGPVNLVAAEELARIEEEHGANADEQAELAEAVSRLRGSIGNLNREGRERLRAAFEDVDNHFRTLFARLFQGGRAHLALIDSDDPLEAGLEIYAQPPGKKLQSLTLLSGGEQALTAIALIFALFLTNPAPICVLDEVDAPLDDANIERFCDLLEAMVSETRTRYLIVTHNAVTMSRMHRLFGVTMAEKGISRLVSVDLSEAELMAAE